MLQKIAMTIIPMNRRCKSYEMILTSNYISKHVILHVLGCGHESSNDVFEFVKREELKNAPIINGEKLDIRPRKVPTNLFLRLMNIDRKHLEKQYDLIKQTSSDRTIKKDETSRQANVTS